jgi:hypothetical protein
MLNIKFVTGHGMVSNYADPRYGTIQKFVYNRYSILYTDSKKKKTPEKSME